LATADSDRLEAYASYGHHLGLLIQISDDLEDIYPPEDAGVYGQRRPFARSLPVVYALDVIPAQQAVHLKDCLRDAPLSAKAAQEALDIVDRSGAADYVSVVIEQHKNEAIQALERADPRSPAGEALAALVAEF
jgi:geranylgeranyl pyrophosphate synthase